MKLILRLLLSLGLSLGLVGSANAQTGCSTLTLSSLLALFNDNVPPGSITPADIRDLICSVPTLAGAPAPLGTLAFQNANAVSITGGTILGTNINALLGPPFTSGLANYAATPIYSGVKSAAGIFSALGSATTPDATTNATAIFQKTTIGGASGSQTNPAVYASSTKTGAVSGNRATAMIAEGYDIAGGNGTFVEGGRFHGTLSAGATSGQANGIICLAQSTGTTAWNFLIGCEAAVENAGFDAPVSTSFNQNHFATDFLATIQNAGSHIGDAGFMINPFNSKTFRVGFFVPPGSTEVTDSAFRSAATSVYGMDLRFAVNTSAIALPNNTPVTVLGVGGADVNIFYLASGSNSLIIGTGTQGFTLPAVSAPSTPGAGFFDVYMDVADNKLKAKGPSGTVTVLALP